MISPKQRTILELTPEAWFVFPLLALEIDYQPQSTAGAFTAAIRSVSLSTVTQTIGSRGCVLRIVGDETQNAVELRI